MLLYKQKHGYGGGRDGEGHSHMAWSTPHTYTGSVDTGGNLGAAVERPVHRMVPQRPLPEYHRRGKKS